MIINKPSAAHANIFRVCELLETKHSIFKELIAEAEVLNDAIRRHDIESIETALTKWRSYMEHINLLDKELFIIKNKNPLLEEMMSLQTRKRLYELKNAIENVINKTIKLNHNCALAAENELKTLLKDIADTDRGQKSLKNYKQKMNFSRFLDIKT